jgi:hypothetical protein
VSSTELAQLVTQSRCHRGDGFFIQIVLDVMGESAGRLITTRPILLHRLHHHPIEVPLQRTPKVMRVRLAMPGDSRAVLDGERVQPGRRFEGFLFADAPADFIIACAEEFLCIEGRACGQQFVEKHPE